VKREDEWRPGVTVYIDDGMDLCQVWEKALSSKSPQTNWGRGQLQTNWLLAFRSRTRLRLPMSWEAEGMSDDEDYPLCGHHNAKDAWCGDEECDCENCGWRG